MDHTLSREQLAAVSRLWDQAEQLDAAERDQWLRHLPAGLSAVLQRMLIDRDAIGSDPFMNTLPKLPDCGPELPCAYVPLTAGATVGPYRLLKRLGSGGTSEVWLAARKDGMLKRTVALKLPHPWLVDPQFRERLEREREILESLEHRFIAHLYDAGLSAEGQPYLALEQVEGLMLTEHCNANGLDVTQRLELFLQALEAVQHAHAHRVVHRDIKPSNILVNRSGEVRLLDFGIAELIPDDAEDPARRQGGRGAHTPSYASPEQVAGEPVDEGTDVYSLGVVLYELLGGRRPYGQRHASRASLEEAILKGDIARPSTVLEEEHAGHCMTALRTLRRQLRGDLDTIVLTALKRHSHQRYVSVEAFADDIRRHLAGQAVLARPDGVLYRSGKLLRRHGVLAALVAAVFASLAAGIVIAVWQAHEAREHSRIAQQQTRVAKASLDFMEEVFTSNSAYQPTPAKARQTTARELLDNGVRRIDTALQDAPQARLHLLRTLARMYFELDLPQQGLALLRQRIELARTLHTGDDPRVLDAQLSFAEMAIAGPARDEAAKMLREVQAQLDRQGDQGSRQRGRLEHITSVGHSLASANSDPQRALMHASTAVSVLQRHPHGGELVLALEQKAIAQQAMGQLAQARDALTEALRVAGSLAQGADTAMRQTTQVNLLRRLCAIGLTLSDGPRAEAHCRQSLTLTAQRYGPQAPAAVESAAMLGQALIDTSRSAAALALLQPYLDAGAATDHPGVRLLLAEALLNRGKPAEALKLLDAVDLSGVDAQVLEQRAQALADLGRYTQASQVLSKALDHRLASGSADSPAFNSHLIVRARLALAQQQPQGAIDAARSMRLPPGHESPLSPDVLERDVLLAQSALAQKQFAEAAQKAAALRTRIANGPHPALLDEWLQRAESVLGEAQLRAGQAGAAQDCLKHALELSLALRDGQAPALSHSHALLGLARLAGGDQAAAAKHLRAAEDIEAAVGALPPHQAQALRELQSRIPAAVVARTR